MNQKAEQPQDTLIGTTVGGKYHIKSRLGEGGMGVVYKAIHVDIDRPVAIKVLLFSDPVFLERFRREAKATGSLNHPNIVDVTDFGQLDDGRLFFVMEFLRGRSLTDVIKDDAPLEPQRLVRLMSQTCSALAAAHDRNILHRDIKPDNIFVVPREDGEVAKLLDFGIVKSLDGSEQSKLTRTGQFCGTPNYLSPEQATGEALDSRSDIYCLGLVLYEMATGTMAVQGDSVYSILMRQMSVAPTAPAEVEPNSPAATLLNDVIMKALAKEKRDRYASMRELSDAMRVAVGLPPTGQGALVGAVPLVGLGAAGALAGAGVLGSTQPTANFDKVLPAGAPGPSRQTIPTRQADAMVTSPASPRSNKLLYGVLAGGAALLGLAALLFWLAWPTDEAVSDVSPATQAVAPSTQAPPVQAARATPTATPTAAPKAAPTAAPIADTQPEVPPAATVDAGSGQDEEPLPAVKRRPGRAQGDRAGQSPQGDRAGQDSRRQPAADRQGKARDGQRRTDRPHAQPRKGQGVGKDRGKGKGKGKVKGKGRRRKGDDD